MRRGSRAPRPAGGEAPSPDGPVRGRQAPRGPGKPERGMRRGRGGDPGPAEVGVSAVGCPGLGSCTQHLQRFGRPSAVGDVYQGFPQPRTRQSTRLRFVKRTRSFPRRAGTDPAGKPRRLTALLSSPPGAISRSPSHLRLAFPESPCNTRSLTSEGRGELSPAPVRPGRSAAASRHAHRSSRRPALPGPAPGPYRAARLPVRAAPPLPRPPAGQQRTRP